MTNVQSMTDKDEEYEALAHVSIDSGVKFFILRPAISCTFCVPGTCQVVLRLMDSKGLCEGTKKTHYGEEILYMQKVDVYMEDELLPHIYIKNSNISELMMDEKNAIKGEEESIVNVTSSNYFLSTLFILILVYGLLTKWMNHRQATKKQSRRYFYGVHNKKTLKHSSHNEVISRNPQSPSMLTSHKLVDVSNTGSKMQEKENPIMSWEVVSRKRNFKYWYGPIKPGDLYSDS